MYMKNIKKNLINKKIIRCLVVAKWQIIFDSTNSTKNESEVSGIIIIKMRNFKNKISFNLINDKNNDD